MQRPVLVVDERFAASFPHYRGEILMAVYARKQTGTRSRPLI